MRRKYDIELKTTIAELLKSSKTAAEVSQEYDLSEDMVRLCHRYRMKDLETYLRSVIYLEQRLK